MRQRRQPLKKKTCALPVVHRGQTESIVIVEVSKLRGSEKTKRDRNVSFLFSLPFILPLSNVDEQTTNFQKHIAFPSAQASPISSAESTTTATGECPKRGGIFHFFDNHYLF